MADKFRFYRISEANAEISRLDGEVAALKTKLEAATSDDSEIAAQASALKSENDEIKRQCEIATKERDEARVDAKNARAEAATHCAEFDVKVKTAAATEAATIVASQGARAPLKAGLSADPANPKPTLDSRSRDGITSKFRENVAAVKKQQGF